MVSIETRKVLNQERDSLTKRWKMSLVERIKADRIERENYPFVNKDGQRFRIIDFGSWKGLVPMDQDHFKDDFPPKTANPPERAAGQLSKKT